jgi:uncharacterized protein
MSQAEGSVARFDCWQPTPEGALIHQGEGTAVIADLHLGYEWARGAAGDCVPAHSLDEVLAKLSRMLDRASLTRLVVAGDLVESARPCRRTAADVRGLRAWLAARGVTLVALEGNHDRPWPSIARRPGLPAGRCLESITVADWTIGHGHLPLRGPRVISGHHHPVFRFEGSTAPCFLVGTGRIVLPAFSSNAAGFDVLTGAMPADCRASQFACIVATGRELLDFGPLADLRGRLRGKAR